MTRSSALRRGSLPLRRAVAFAVHGGVPGDPARPVLAVLRPPDDDELPDVWGLPATGLRSGEGWEDALRRAGREKLGVELDPLAVVGEGARDRPGGSPPERGGDGGADDGGRDVEAREGGYRLHMRVYEARVRRGEPSVSGTRGEDEGDAVAATAGGTRYVDWKWAEPEALRPAAEQGSLCTRIYLEAMR